jgi:hypothetical protein
MASAKPHLLTLPREIRDLIYTYLSHDVVFEWGYRTFSFPIGGSHATTVQVHGIPSLSALLTCTRMSEEYSAAPSFMNVSLSLTAGTDSQRCLREDAATNQDRALDLFSHIQHVNFRIDILDQPISQRVWLWIHVLTAMVSEIAPELTTVRVAMQHVRHMGSQVGKPCSGGILGSPLPTGERTSGYTAVALGGMRSRGGYQVYWNRALDTTAMSLAGNWNDAVGRLVSVQLDVTRQEWLFDLGVKEI